MQIRQGLRFMKFKGMEVKGMFEVREKIGFFEVWQNGNMIYLETTKGDDYWVKYEYDNQGKRIYVENSNGVIRDYRTKKVFRLYKFLEDEFLTSKEKADLVFSGWAQELEGKTYKEASYKLLHDKWLVEEEIK